MRHCIIIGYHYRHCIHPYVVYTYTTSPRTGVRGGAGAGAAASGDAYDVIYIINMHYIHHILQVQERLRQATQELAGLHGTCLEQQRAIHAHDAQTALLVPHTRESEL